MVQAWGRKWGSSSVRAWTALALHLLPHPRLVVMGLSPTFLPFLSTPSGAGWTDALVLLCVFGLLCRFATAWCTDLLVRSSPCGAYEAEGYDLDFLEDLEGDPWPIYASFLLRPAHGLGHCGEVRWARADMGFVLLRGGRPGRVRGAVMLVPVTSGLPAEGGGEYTTDESQHRPGCRGPWRDPLTGGSAGASVRLLMLGTRPVSGRCLRSGGPARPE